MRIATLLLLKLVLAINAWSADSLFFYGTEGREYYPVDTTRVLVKWAPFGGTFGGSGYLVPYPSISPTTLEVNKIDSYILHTMIGSYSFQSVVNQLRTDPNVESVNEVLVIDTVLGLYLYFGDHIVCQFPAGTAPAFVDSICVANQLVVESESQYISRQYVLRRLPGATLSTHAVANALHELPSTQWAHPDWIGNGIVFGYALFDEYLHTAQWNVRKTIDYKDTTNYGAWELTRGSSSVIVAVLDQGMEAHEDFDTSKWEPGVDFTPVDGFDLDPSPITPEPPGIFDAHGMAVLGIISAAHNNPVIVGDEFGGTPYSSSAGMAPMSSIIPVRIGFPDGSIVSTSKIANAINYAVAAGADVINCSWGYYSAAPPVVITAINNAVVNGRSGKGCIVVAASGNLPGPAIAYPARDSAVIGVGAIAKNDEVHNYSSGGNQLDLVAPSGGGCKGANGEVCQDPSNSFYTTDRMDAIGYNTKEFGSCFPSQDRDYVCTFWGTSSAAPAVTGEVALLLALEPNLTRAQVLAIIRKSARKVLAWGTLTGSDSLFYGQGRASAVRALSTVRRGDCNASGSINVADINYLTAYFYSGGPAPFPDKYFGDANCTGGLNVGDITYLIRHLFQGGPPPAKPCTAFLLD